MQSARLWARSSNWENRSKASYHDKKKTLQQAGRGCRVGFPRFQDLLLQKTNTESTYVASTPAWRLAPVRYSSMARTCFQLYTGEERRFGTICNDNRGSNVPARDCGGETGPSP